MKTMQEFYDELVSSEELKKELQNAAKDKESLEAFFKARDCDFTAEEFGRFLQEKSEEMPENDLKAIAGGGDDEDDLSAQISAMWLEACVPFNVFC